MNHRRPDNKSKRKPPPERSDDTDQHQPEASQDKTQGDGQLLSLGQLARSWADTESGPETQAPGSDANGTLKETAESKEVSEETSLAAYEHQRLDSSGSGGSVGRVQRRMAEFNARTSPDTRASAIPDIRGLNLRVLNLRVLNLYAGYTDEDMRYALEWRISPIPVEDQYPDSMDRMGRVLVELGVKDVVVAKYQGWDREFAERLGGGLYTLGVHAVIQDLLSANYGTRAHAEGNEGKSRPSGGASWAQTVSQGLPPKSDAREKGQTGGNEENSVSPPPEESEPSPSAADLSSEKAIVPTRPCRLVFNPHLPLSPEPSGIQLTEEDTCPKMIRFYHGSHHAGYDSVLSFQTAGVERTGPKSFYTRRTASYWTTSSSFAIWWAARRQASCDAMRYALDDSPSRTSLSLGDNIPRDLSSVSCLLVACDAEKEVLWDPAWNWIVFETEEENMVCNLNLGGKPNMTDGKDFVMGFSMRGALQHFSMIGHHQGMLGDQPVFLAGCSEKASTAWKEMSQEIMFVNPSESAQDEHINGFKIVESARRGGSRGGRGRGKGKGRGRA